MRCFIAALVLLGLVACASRPSTQSQPAADAIEDSSHPPAHPEVRVGTYGTACLTFRDRTHPSNVSYRAKDVGKTGVPRLTEAQITLLRRIQNYVHSETLRFAFVRREFLVFDATDGPCADFAPGYWIMNSVDLYFEPGEAPGSLGPGPTEVEHTPGPWMRAP